MFGTFQALYKEDFEKNKGKGFSVVVDTPEMQRLKKTQDQISNVSGRIIQMIWCKSWTKRGAIPAISHLHYIILTAIFTG